MRIMIEDLSPTCLSNGYEESYMKLYSVLLFTLHVHGVINRWCKVKGVGVRKIGEKSKKNR